MAKKSIRNREIKKILTCKRFTKKRQSLKDALHEAIKSGDMNKTMELQMQFQKLPRNASPSRVRRRCKATGRSRGNYRKVGLSKIKFREYAMRGEIPGLVMASW